MKVFDDYKTDPPHKKLHGKESNYSSISATRETEAKRASSSLLGKQRNVIVSVKDSNSSNLGSF